MTHKVLIANRGEIALRIQRACRSLNLPFVQACSEADLPARYVQMADEHICIGPARAAQSYLDRAALIAAAHATGATMVHPGYGFLSEQAQFAQDVAEEGLIFVGPPADAIRRMGDKISARQCMIASDVPCIPGSEGALPDDPDALRAIAARIGYPVIVKASAGGGGRGMRVVEIESALTEAVALTREEARNAFGNSELYLERYLTTPRHVELQVLCDGHGTCIHLGDRDCSLQRRHQKVIEEAPAPGVDRDLIDRVAARCLQACRDMSYRGAGTFEFLYEDGALYFIEMNTRLQVEHPVTEAITGVDIVAAQLRIAMGEPLGLTQEDITFSGHAIECRINAEDPKTLTPSPGTISHWTAPEIDGLRLETHVYAGYTVPPQYDSLIGKAITHGADRSDAITRMTLALDGIKVAGIATNIALHQRLLRDPVIARGGMGISYLGTLLAEETAP